MECSCGSKHNDGTARSCFFEVHLTHKGKSKSVEVSPATTGLDLHQATLAIVFGVVHDRVTKTAATTTTTPPTTTTTTEVLKLLFKGKRILPQPDVLPFRGLGLETKSKSREKKPPKIMVIATNASAIRELATKRSDPLIRGFDRERAALDRRRSSETASQKYWGDVLLPDREYKFCRLVACEDHYFGHRSTESTPHAFRAMELLQKLASDPGVVAIMKERELVVGTLGEMDPIDDRIMQKTEAQGGGGVCLLGYNTNRGLRIDLKLRTDDLSGFRHYADLAGTLIHELSHNWVGDHNLLFWTNYAQMRAEYFCTHARLRRSAIVVRGKKTAELAGLPEAALDDVFAWITNELVREMGQFGLHPSMLAGPLSQRIRELERETITLEGQQGYRLGGGSAASQKGAPASSGTSSGTSHQAMTTTARELALAAAERRAREQREKEGTKHHRNR